MIVCHSRRHNCDDFCFSLSKNDLLSLNVSLTEAPLWVQMMLAFRDAAESHCGSYEFVIVIQIFNGNLLSLQCFDTVGWVTGRASGL